MVARGLLQHSARSSEALGSLLKLSTGSTLLRPGPRAQQKRKPLQERAKNCTDVRGSCRMSKSTVSSRLRRVHVGSCRMANREASTKQAEVGTRCAAAPTFRECPKTEEGPCSGPRPGTSKAYDSETPRSCTWNATTETSLPSRMAGAGRVRNGGQTPKLSMDRAQKLGAHGSRSA